jgi:hypothetical protein
MVLDRKVDDLLSALLYLFLWRTRVLPRADSSAGVENYFDDIVILLYHHQVMSSKCIKDRLKRNA